MSAGKVNNMVKNAAFVNSLHDLIAGHGLPEKTETLSGLFLLLSWKDPPVYIFQ